MTFRSAWKISIWTALRKRGWIFNEGSPATGQCATGRNRETRRIEGTVPTRGNGSESEDNVRRGSTRRGAKAERSHCDSINDSVVVAMRDPVREALYGPLRRRDRILQRVIPSLYASFGVSKFQRLRHRCASRCPGHDTPVSQMKSLFDAPLSPPPRRGVNLRKLRVKSIACLKMHMRVIVMFSKRISTIYIYIYIWSDIL